MKSAVDKNTSVFPNGDISRAETQRRGEGGSRFCATSKDRSGWTRVRLGDIGEISGSGVDKKIHVGEQEITLLNYLDVYHKNVIERNDLNHKVTATQKQIRRCFVQAGDVFFTPTSETPDDIARCCITSTTMEDVVYSYHVVRLRPTININSKFLMYACCSNDFRVQAEASCAGSGTRYVITLPKFRELTINLPDIHEQDRIAESITACETQIAALQSLIAKYEAIKKATVNLLLKPKGGWLDSTMGDSFELSRGIVISKSEIEKHPGVYPVYSSQSVNDGVLGLIDSYRYDGEYITWTTDGANAGTVFYRQGRFNCTNVCGVAKARTSEICPAFVALMIAQYAKSYVSYVGNPKLMSNIFAQIAFSYPNISEQRKIVARISAIDDALKNCHAQLSKAKSLKQGMMSYFFG